MKYILLMILYLSVSETSNAQTVPDSVSNTQKVSLSTRQKTSRPIKKIDKPEKVLVTPPHKVKRKED